MRRLLVILLFLIIPNGCKPVFLPGMYGPHQDHNLNCIGGKAGECRLGERGSFGKL